MFSRIHLSKLFLAFIISFLLGVFLASFYFDAAFVEMIIVTILVILGVLMLDFFDWRILGIFFLGAVLGFGRFAWEMVEPEKFVGNYLGNVVFEGCIDEEVDVRRDKVKYVFDVSELLFDGERLALNGRVLVNAFRYPLYQYGSCLLVKGRLDLPRRIEDFAYDKYLARYGIDAVMYEARFRELEGEGVGNLFFENVFLLKLKFEERMNRIFGEPHASFMAGLVLGSRKGIPEHLMEDFNTTGLTHIIAISGYNITLLIVIVAGFLGFLSRKVRVVVSVVVIFVFVVLVGASAAVVRAGIMGAISLFAIWFGRTYYVGIALFASAFFMNLWNPFILVYDIGFQLSFLATCGLIYVSPLIEKWFLWLPKNFEIRESVLMTMSAQIMALPVIVYNFGRLSLISPVANLFVLPFIPLTMFFGFLAVVSSVLSEVLGYLFGFVGYILLEIMIFFVKLFAAVPLASVDIFLFDWWMLIVYYVGLLWWLRGRGVDIF
jgi:competence protein ComEC